jgi:hypothetical protein
MNAKSIIALPPTLLRMKRSAIKILAVVYFCLSSSFVHAGPIDGIHILSQRYSASGSWKYTVNAGRACGSSTNYSGTYGGGSDGIPINTGYTAPELNNPTLGNFSPVVGNTSINALSFSASAVCIPDGAGFIGSDGDTYLVDSPEVNSQATASWTFQPTGGNVQLTLDFDQDMESGNFNSLSVTLSDITDMNTLLAYNNTLNYGFQYIQQSDAYSLDSGDTYRLTIASRINAGESSQDCQNLTCCIGSTLEPAPEPSTFCLFPLALVGFLASRKHLRDNAAGNTACPAQNSRR